MTARPVATVVVNFYADSPPLVHAAQSPIPGADIVKLLDDSGGLDLSVAFRKPEPEEHR